MKAFVLLICFLLSMHSNSFSQEIGNYRPLEFDGLLPLWSHVAIDSTIIDHVVPNARDPHTGFDGYSHIYTHPSLMDEELIHGGYLYKIMRTIYDSDISGGLIEKMDLQNGKVQWKAIFDLRSNSFREFIKKAVISNGKLILYAYRIRTSDLEFPIPIVALFQAEGTLVTREYDLESGALLHYADNEQLLPSTRIFTTDLDNRIQLNFINDTTLEVLEHRLDASTRACIVIDTIYSNGMYANTSDTIFSEFSDFDWFDSYWSSEYKMLRAADGKLYWLDFYVPGDFTPDPARALLKITDGEQTQTISLDHFNEGSIVKTWRILAVTDEFILLNTHHFDLTSRFIILNKQGEFLHAIHSSKDRHAVIPKLDAKGSFVLPEYGGIRNGKHYLDFLIPDADSLKFLSGFAVSDPRYLTIPAEIQRLDNGDIFISVMHTEEDGSNSLKGRFMTDFRVTPQMIGLETVSTDYSKDYADVILYPNPTQDNLTIQFPSKLTGRIFVSNMAGTILKSFQISDVDSYQCNIDELPAGIYILQYSGMQGYQCSKIYKLD